VSSAGEPRRIALLGNPNTGKTTLFNRLCGLRHKTSNFPGTTQEARVGTLRAGNAELIDLPGIYSLELDLRESEICRRVLDGSLAAPGQPATPPDVILVVADATNLSRNLTLIGEALRRRLPTVVALNLADAAAKRGIEIDVAKLAQGLRCPVVLCSARTGEGLTGATGLDAALGAAAIPSVTPPGTREGLEDWAEALFVSAVRTRTAPAIDLTDRLDRALTHPVVGLLAFAMVMFGLFWSVFSLATVPMDLIEGLFGWLKGVVESALPPGIIRDFLAGGVVAGLGSMLVFLPQILALFFLISLLEDTGYLARGAFVMNRVLRPFGLSGHAFVPLLSSHACALPGIMACRGIPDPRERLATILVAPFMTCSARIPVYVLLTVVLFPGRPLHQAAAFTACYALGIGAGLLSALIARRSVARGPARGMAMELPAYRRPSLRTALITTYDRGIVFVRNAGTNILAICVLLWWLSAYPKVDPPAHVVELRAQADALVAANPTPPPVAGELLDQAAALEATHALEHSFAGRLGKFIQPVFQPLGFDWKLSVGVVTSFAAREVFVSTMAVMATGHDDAEDQGVLRALAESKRDDGATPIFTRPASWALLVYYVLAMQCLPTLAVTAKEAGGWKWAMLQLGWMNTVAYLAALAAHALAVAA